MNPNWQVTDTVRVNGRHVSVGTELAIRGERGAFRFVKHVTNTATGKAWVDVYGGPKGHETIRSFYVGRIRTVRNRRTMRPATGRAARTAVAA